jgi:hypothetical protein
LEEKSMTQNRPKQISPGCSLALGITIGGVAALFGAYIVAISLNIIPSDPNSFEAPRSVVAAAGMLFFLGGVWAAFQSGLGAWGADTPMAKWMQYILVLVMMVIFASMFIWIGFGPGGRSFQTTTSIGPITTSGSGSESSGRCIFGGFGVLAGFATLVYAVRQGMKMINGGQISCPAHTDKDKLE